MRTDLVSLKQTAFGDGTFYGIELMEGNGECDGSIDGVVYFECAPGMGLFARRSALRRIAPKKKRSKIGNDGDSDNDHDRDRDHDCARDHELERVITQAFKLFSLRGELVGPVRPVDHSGQPHHAAVRVRLDLVGFARAQKLAKPARSCDPRGRRQADLLG